MANAQALKAPTAGEGGGRCARNILEAVKGAPPAPSPGPIPLAAPLPSLQALYLRTSVEGSGGSRPGDKKAGHCGVRARPQWSCPPGPRPSCRAAGRFLSQHEHTWAHQGPRNTLRPPPGGHRRAWGVGGGLPLASCHWSNGLASRLQPSLQLAGSLTLQLQSLADALLLRGARGKRPGG